MVLRFTFHLALSHGSYGLISSGYFWISFENHRPGPERHKYDRINACQGKNSKQNFQNDSYRPSCVSAAPAYPPPSPRLHPFGSHLPPHPCLPPYFLPPGFLKRTWRLWEHPAQCYSSNSELNPADSLTSMTHTITTIIKVDKDVYCVCSWNTDEGRGRSCCLLSRCGPRRWMRVPTSCSPASRPSPDWPPLWCLWAFSVWVWLERIQPLAAHTLHLEQERDGHVSNQVDGTWTATLIT